MDNFENQTKYRILKNTNDPCRMFVTLQITHADLKKMLI